MEELSLSNEEFKNLVQEDNDGFISLTGLFRASKRDRGSDPNSWLKHGNVVDFINTACDFLNTTQECIIKTRKGRTGGTFAHRQIALAYAKYLSPELHIFVNRVFFERIEEVKNPDLIADRYRETYKKKGKDDKWINERFVGKEARKGFTSTLSSHGVKDRGYADCTNAIYEPIYGGDASLVRTEKGLSKSDSIRDNMSTVELAAIRLAELIASEEIEKKMLYGNVQCEAQCKRSSTAIATGVINGRR